MTAPARTVSPRIQSVDIVRGAVMVLMAIDHVRVYSGLPAGGATAGIFFTRWITHFCAPVFAFLAGTSAFLYGRKLGDKRALARYLATRGLLLVILELTLIRFAWTFNLDYSRFVLAGVIWMLGWSMVALAGLVWLPTAAVAGIGIGVMFFQQVFRFLPHWFPKPVQDAIGWLWEFIYPAGYKPWDGMAILYVLAPWVGVMAAGYGFGAILTRDAAARRKICLTIGLAATVCFLVAGPIAIALQPAHHDTRPFLFQLLDQRKYPASQLYLFMTLGPAIALMPLAERARGWIGRVLGTFGRVPMFYYLLHIPAIHVAALAVNGIRGGQAHPEWYNFAPFTNVPPDHRWGLPLLYAVYLAIVTALYFACRWYASVKARHPGSWLRFI